MVVLLYVIVAFPGHSCCSMFKRLFVSLDIIDTLIFVIKI